MTSPISRQRLADVIAQERQLFRQRCPQSQQLASAARDSLLDGVPMHWMADWSTPFPLFVADAQGARFRDVDGNHYVDFCLGDTGAMTGHSPAAVQQALATQAGKGLTTMLPSADAIWVGNELKRRFGLDYWQIATTATDANRYVLRWARAASERKVIVVFDGCYHGTVDDTMVRLRDGKTVARNGLLGQVHDLGLYTRAVPFNDLAALEAALAPGDVAAVLTEPAMTNIGMVMPDPDFHRELRRLTRRYGSYLIIDETHTISTGVGGYTRAFHLEPDFFVMGKPIAGGLPCAIYGCTKSVAEAMLAARKKAQQSGGHGHSGMGTTLSANPLQLACMRATLEHVLTEKNYQQMLALAQDLADGLRALIAQHQMPWCVTHIGARVEFQFRATPPRTGVEAEAGFDDELEQALHLYLLNRGVMITPFHNMMLICPATTADDVQQLLNCFSRAITTLKDQE